MGYPNVRTADRSDFGITKTVWNPNKFVRILDTFRTEQRFKREDGKVSEIRTCSDFGRLLYVSEIQTFCSIWAICVRISDTNLSVRSNLVPNRRGLSEIQTCSDFRRLLFYFLFYPGHFLYFKVDRVTSPLPYSGSKLPVLGLRL